MNSHKLTNPNLFSRSNRGQPSRSRHFVRAPGQNGIDNFPRARRQPGNNFRNAAAIFRVGRTTFPQPVNALQTVGH